MSGHGLSRGGGLTTARYKAQEESAGGCLRAGVLSLATGCSQGAGDESNKPGGVLHAGQVLSWNSAAGRCDQLGSLGVMYEGNSSVQPMPRPS